MSCFQEFPEALPAAECRANNPAELFVLPEATQLAVVAAVYQGTVRLFLMTVCDIGVAITCQQCIYA